MDREIPAAERSRTTWRRRAVWAVALAVAAGGALALPALLRPSIELSSLRFATVERGPVSASVTAAGTVLPAFEQAVSSPVEARVLRILKRPGEAVRAGEPLVELDTTTSRLELGRLDDRRAAKQNEREQARLDLAARLAALEGRRKSQALDAEVAEYRAAQSRRLRAEGLVSDEALKAAEVAAEKARIDADQAVADVANARQAGDLRLAGLALDLATLGRERDEAAHELALTSAQADRDGVVTWTVPQEGATVRRGDVLARVAGLDSYRVEATISDVHSTRLRPGLAVRVRLDGRTLDGTLTSVYPTIENGAVRFRVDLATPRDAALRNNLRVDVEVETGAAVDGLRLHRGPGVAGGEQEVYVVNGDRAERRRVRFGITGADDLEVLEGLALGERVVISDLRDVASPVLRLR